MKWLTTRRAVLVGSVAAGVLAFTKQHRLWPWFRRASAAEMALVRRIDAIANASSELSRLGELQQHYFTRETASELIDELFPGSTLEQISSLSDAKLEESLRLATRADFDAGRVVPVAGWLLARTEALLCRLAVV
jgi:hypothetical protein